MIHGLDRTAEVLWNSCRVREGDQRIEAEGKVRCCEDERGTTDVGMCGLWVENAGNRFSFPRTSRSREPSGGGGQSADTLLFAY